MDPLITIASRLIPSSTARTQACGIVRTVLTFPSHSRRPRVQVLKPGRAVLGFTPAFVTRLVPNLALWGFAGAGVLFLAGSSIPLFQTE